MKKRFSNIPLYLKKIGLRATLYYFLQRLVLGEGKLIELKFPGVARKLYLRNKSYDTNIFFQIFIREELGFLKNVGLRIHSVIDAGANIGLSSIYLKNLFPDAVLHSIEPATVNFELLEKNLKGYPDVTVQLAALVGKERKVSISNPSANFASFRVGSDNGKGQLIGGFSLSNFLCSAGFSRVDFVKMDIEGSETEVFENIDEATLSKVGAFAIEIHPDLHPHAETLIKGKLARFRYTATGGEYSYFQAN